MALVDVDEGNSGSIRRSGRDSAIVLPWNVDPSTVLQWAERHLHDVDVVVIDCGANMVASGTPVNEFLGELVMVAQEAGGQIYLFAIAPTNAQGTGRLIDEMRRAYGDLAQVIIIQNNQDGSGNFSKSLDIVGRKKATFQQIPAGIQAARLLKVAPLLSVLSSPPEGYNVAMANLAQLVADFMSELAVVDLFGAAAVAHVRTLAIRASGKLEYIVSAMTEATDAALLANAAHCSSSQHLLAAVRRDRGDLASIGRAALDVFDTRVAFEKACE